MTRALRFGGTQSMASWLLLVAAAISGCAGVSMFAVSPNVELVGLDLQGTTNGQQRFALTFLVSNPNTDPLPVDAIRYTVRLSSEGYLDGRSATQVVIPASGRQTVRIELESDSVSSASRLLALTQGPDNALQYELSGNLILATRPPRMLAFAFRGAVPLTVARTD